MKLATIYFINYERLTEILLWEKNSGNFYNDDNSAKIDVALGSNARSI